MSAEIRARGWLCMLAGPADWNLTREAWLARGARKAGITYRRARALFYNEKIRLTANEYLGIEREYAAAVEAMASLSRLAGEADVSAHRRDGREG